MPARLLERGEPWLTVVGRLAPGVTAAQAGGDLQGVATGLAAAHPDATRQRSLVFAPMVDGNPEVRSLAPYGWMALGVVGVVLLIACFNVAALLLARASDRQREIGVRTALGASRSRIIRQFAVEGLLLAVASGAAAIVVAGWSADLLSAFSLPSPIPQRLHIGVDHRLIGFTVVLVAFAGIVPALLPALQATRVNLVASMRMETALGPRRSRWRNAFMVAQIAGATLFLTTALLFLRSFWTQASTNPGFDTAHLVVLELKPSDFNYDAARSRVLFEHLVERVRARAGRRTRRARRPSPLLRRLPEDHQGVSRRNRLRDDRLPECLRVRDRTGLHGRARRARRGRRGVQPAARDIRPTASSSAGSWPSACGRDGAPSGSGFARGRTAASSASSA